MSSYSPLDDSENELSAVVKELQSLINVATKVQQRIPITLDILTLANLIHALLNSRKRKAPRKGKDLLEGSSGRPDLGGRPDPVQEARKRPRIPLMAPSKSPAEEPAKPKVGAKPKGVGVKTAPPRKR